MRIAVVAPTEIPARRANTLQVMKMTQAIAKAGYEVRLAAPRTVSRSPVVGAGDRLPSTETSWEGLARHYGLTQRFPIEWLPASPHLRRYDYGLRAVNWAFHWGAGLLYTRLPQAASVASQLGMKTILEVHDLPQGVLGRWLLRRFISGRGAWRLVVITQALADDLAQRLGISIAPPAGQRPGTILAPDGVDLERYSGLPPEPVARQTLIDQAYPGLTGTLQPERFTVGYTGHLYPGRGSNLLIALAACMPEVTFLVVGGEPQEVARLQDEAAARQLENFILTGFVPNADLPLYQAACEALLMPYQQRVAASSGGDIAPYLSPMKVFEYMACERAILSSDLPVLREVLNPQNAILLPGDNPEAWETALRSLMSDSALRQRLAAQARRDVEQYTWDARVEKIFARSEQG